MFVIQRDFGHRGPSHFSMQLLCQSLGMLLMAFEQFQALFQQRFQLRILRIGNERLTQGFVDGLMIYHFVST